jgi:sialate O-acetylesterase
MVMKFKIQLLLGICLFLNNNFVFAQNKGLSLSSIFSDHMVLQQARRIPVWGMGEPNAKIVVKFSNQVHKTTVNKLGEWRTYLGPMHASFVARKLTISSSGRTIIFRDVLVGEVWLCSGQSNMVMSLGSITDPFFGVDGGDKEIKQSVIKGIRLYNDNHLYDQKLKLNTWLIADSSAKAPFSAVAWFFGKNLRQRLHIPIGLINISAGGSPIQEWMTPASANSDSLIRAYKLIYDEHKTEIDDYAKKSYEYWKYGSTNKTLTPPMPLAKDVMLAGRFGKPGALFTSMLAPIIPYPIKGVIWYQGEANADYIADANYYNHLLETMIADWRTKWDNKSLPFYYVQLPCWNHGSIWPLMKLRELEASNEIPNAGMVVTADICDSTNLHPREKKPIGERLANLALAKAYNKKLTYKGPEVKNIVVNNGALIIVFNSNGPSKKLVITANWDNVEIAGDDGVFYPAKTSVNNNIAVVTNENVKMPRYIRYGWLKLYKPSLFNSAGLPLPAFYYKISNGSIIIPELPINEIIALEEL